MLMLECRIKIILVDKHVQLSVAGQLVLGVSCKSDKFHHSSFFLLSVLGGYSQRS